MYVPKITRRGPANHKFATLISEMDIHGILDLRRDFGVGLDYMMWVCLGLVDIVGHMVHGV